MNHDIYAGEGTRSFVVSVGEDNGPAFRQAGFAWPSQEEPEDADDLATRLRDLAADMGPTHGRYFPKIGQEPDLHTVANSVADACERRSGQQLWMRSGE